MKADIVPSERVFFKPISDCTSLQIELFVFQACTDKPVFLLPEVGVCHSETFISGAHAVSYSLIQTLAGGGMSF